jgi:hypothetical protein
MAVHRADVGCNVQPGAQIIAAMDAVQTSIAVNDPLLLQVGCTVSVGTEDMRVDQLSPADPPGQPDAMMTVVRAYNDTTGAAHSNGAPIVSAQDSLRVTRGLHTTTAASHAASTPVHELTPELNSAKVSRLGSVASHSAGASIIDVDGLGGYALTASALAATTPAVLDAPASSVQTALTITNGTALQSGWVVVVDNEKMQVTDVTPTSMTVVRGVHGTLPASHASGAQVRGPVMVEFSYGREGTMLTSTSRTADCTGAAPSLSVEGLSFGCSSTGSALGAVGGGTLGFIEVWGQQLVPNTVPTSLTITAQLTDASGDPLSSQIAPPPAIKVLKCADVNGNGTVNAADATLILQGFFGIIPLVPGTMDINLSGSVTAADATQVLQIFFISQPLGALKRCLPPEP